MRVRTIRSRAGDDAAVEAAAARSLPKPALTEQEAAQYIGMSAAWLKKSRTQRFREVIDAPPFIRAGAKRVVYRREDLDAWQERHLEQVGPVRTIVTEAAERFSEEPDLFADRTTDRDAHR
jgi:predicted DNA-binding transcriptional regulator AlpA